MFKIVVGCYEQLVMGYTVTRKLDDDRGLKWEPYFSDHAQTGCIKCLAAGSRYVASGSSDETICLYDMYLGEELGCLQGHSGAVTQLMFPDKQHLISSSDDGDISIWEASPDGALLRTLKGHSGAVASFAIHPTGKLGMSVSPKDGTLRTWNLMTGKSVYIKSFKNMLFEFVRWSNDGKHYVIASTRHLNIFELATAKCVFEIDFPEQILTVEFLTFPLNDFIAIGDSSGCIHILHIPSGKNMCKFQAHDNRIKCLLPFIPPPDFECGTEAIWLVTVSSNGAIKVWSIDEAKLRKSDDKTAECLLTIETTARLTCVTVWHENLKELTCNVNLSEKSSQPAGKATRKRKRVRGKKALNEKKTNVDATGE